MAPLVDCDAIRVQTLNGEAEKAAHALNAYMHNHVEARAQYRRVWGISWTPLPAIGGEQYFPLPTHTLRERIRALFAR